MSDPYEILGVQRGASEEEIKRIVPVIKNLKKEVHIPLSIDTYKADVAEEALKLGVDMVNVHAAGTIPMMKAAVEGLIEGTPEGMNRPLCIAVTQLTSTTEVIWQML